MAADFFMPHSLAYFTPATQPAPDQILQQLGAAIRRLPETMRPAVADNLRGWAASGADDSYRVALTALLAAAAAIPPTPTASARRRSTNGTPA